MLKVGLTGGIGAGKTTVAKIFETFGIPVYYADQQAKRLMETDHELIKKIKEHFSEAAYTGAKVNSTFLAGIVFKDKKKLALLNSLVHPYSIQDGLRWMKEQTSPYAIKEAALIFESDSQHEFNLIIGVFTPTALRMARTITRDQQSKENISERMENQMDESMKMKMCDVVLMNDEQELLIPQVIALHQKLLTRAAEGLTHG